MEDDHKRDILALSEKNSLNCRNELSGFHWPSIRISIWAKTHLQSQRLQFIILCAMPSTLVHNSAKNVLFVIFIWTSFVWFAKKNHSYCNVCFVRSFIRCLLYHLMSCNKSKCKKTILARFKSDCSRKFSCKYSKTLLVWFVCFVLWWRQQGLHSIWEIDEFELASKCQFRCENERALKSARSDRTTKDSQMLHIKWWRRKKWWTKNYNKVHKKSINNARKLAHLLQLIFT